MRTHRRAALAALAACALAGCQESRGGFSLGGSPAGLPIAVESIEGAPAPVRTALASELRSAATSRRVELVGSGAAARYRVRGYLSTQTAADGSPQLAFVWDVFDAQARRANRVTGASPVRAAGAWEDLDREALRRLAAESMDGIATFLSATNAGAVPMPVESAAAEEQPAG